MISSYWTGLFNWLGNTAGDASFAYIFALLVNAALATGGGQTLSNSQLVALAISVLFLWSVLNFLDIERIGWFNSIAVILQIATILSLVTVVLALAPSLNSASYVLTSYHNGTGFTQNFYVILLSLLFPLFGFAGYDGPAHLAEETRGSLYAAPMGIVYTVIATGISGFVLILALLFSMQSIENAIDSSSGNSAIEILVQTGGQQTACIFACLLAVNIFFAGTSSITVTSRILFALCRDKATVFADKLSAIDPTFRSPINAVVFLFCVQASLLLIPLNSDGGIEAFYTIVSITVVGLQISYFVPLFWKTFTFIWPAHHAKIDNQLQTSEMNLGVWSFSLSLISVSWLFFTTVLLLLPSTYPVTSKTMNYTIVPVGAVVLFGILNWELNSKFYFRGPGRSRFVQGSEMGSRPNSSLSNREIEPLILGNL